MGIKPHAPLQRPGFTPGGGASSSVVRFYRHNLLCLRVGSLQRHLVLVPAPATPTGRSGYQHGGGQDLRGWHEPFSIIFVFLSERSPKILKHVRSYVAPRKTLQPCPHQVQNLPFNPCIVHISQAKV